MKALAQAGHQVSLLTRDVALESATEGIELQNCLAFDGGRKGPLPKLTWLQNRYCSFWGISVDRVAEVEAVRQEVKADVVVAVGLDVLPYLAGVQSARRVWYAADEWVLHHFSRIFPLQPKTWANFREAAVKGLYERAFSSRVDRVWVVSDRDAVATRLVMHTPSIDVIANGVDAEHFAPREQPERPFSCVMWGRLDFGPNIDAIDWFSKRVLPRVQAVHPHARFTVYGFQPGKEIAEMARTYGFEVIADMPDLRDAVCHHQIVVLPFVSGAGIKNKFLEAAAMARPIVASKVAMNGVNLHGQSPCRIANTPSEWGEILTELWTQDESRAKLGTSARSWVMEHFTWESAARTAVEKLNK